MHSRLQRGGDSCSSSLGDHEPSGKRDASPGEEVSSRGDAGSGTLQWPQDGTGSRKTVPRLRDQLRLGTYMLCFEDQTVEAAYVTAVHAKLMGTDLLLYVLTALNMLMFTAIYWRWFQGRATFAGLTLFNGLAFPAWMAWLMLKGARQWYSMHREELINLTVLLKLALIATMQVTVPSNVLPGTAEADRYRLMVMYWAPLASFVHNMGFRIRFSASVPRCLLWLACHLLAAPYATVCTPRLHPIPGAPTGCLSCAAALMLISVAVPVLCHRSTEMRERRDFVLRILRNRPLVAAN